MKIKFYKLMILICEVIEFISDMLVPYNNIYISSYWKDKINKKTEEN